MNWIERPERKVGCGERLRCDLYERMSEPEQPRATREDVCFSSSPAGLTYRFNELAPSRGWKPPGMPGAGTSATLLDVAV